MNKLIVINSENDLEYSGFKLHKIGLEAIGDPSFDQWQECGQFIQKASGSVSLWLGDWLNYGEKKWGEKYAQAIEETGLEYGTLRDASWVASKIDLSIRNDNLTYQHHREVATLEPDKQKEVLDWAEAEGATTRQTKQKVKDIKWLLPKPVIPEGIFNVIYADPPWHYSDKLFEGYGAAEHHYPTMDIQEICAMKIPTDRNSILFLWVTSPLLEECWEVIRSWGFEYKTSFVWDKVKHNMGHYNSVRHELLLVCTKGSMTPEVMKLYDSVVVEERTEKHSQKPEIFYEIIETLYPNGKYLELFARNTRKGWSSYGNEL